ncbi:MAG: hypothetical protein V4713_12355 [Pseudomonadota bacterium]
MVSTRKPKAPVAQSKPAFLGDQDGIEVAEIVGRGYGLRFAFDRQIARMVRDIEGASYDRDLGVYLVPQGVEAAKLEKAISSIRTEARSVAADLATIKDLARNTGQVLQREINSQHDAEPQISDFREPGKFYGGQVVNANARFVAQFSGYGKIDGAAFIAVHRLADLNNSKLMKGDNIGIVYNEKFLGTVTDLDKRKSDAQLEADYKNELGKEVGGVTLTDRGDKIGVAFDINPVLMARIRRVDGAHFNQADKVWEIPQSNREYVLRTVQEMRIEFADDGKDLAMLKEVAESKMDGAKVSKAFTKDGQESFGKVVAVSDRYVLQKVSGDRFSLHHLATLNHLPEVGQNLSIKYSKGYGTVVDMDKQKALQKSLGR